jgi:hypothetical protein
MSDKPIRAERALILVKVEPVEGTDALPVVGTDAILVGEVTLTNDINMIAKGRMSTSYGGRGGIAGRRVWAYDIAVPMTGNIAGAPDFENPAWFPFAQAAQFGVTDVGAAPVTGKVLAPLSKLAGASITIYIYFFDEDGTPELHILTGCRNNFQMSMGANQENLLRFVGLGLWSIPTNPVDPGDPTYIDPNGDFAIMQGVAVTWAARTDRFKTFEFDMAWEVIADENVGDADGVTRIRLNRAADAMANGTYDPERVLTSDYDRLGAVIAETQEALAFTQPTAGGSDIAFAAQVQYQNPSPNTDQGMWRWGQPFWCPDVSDAGDDYVSLTVNRTP